MAEGGPGAHNEAKIAMINRRFVIPVGCLGGMAEVLGADGHKAGWVKNNGLVDLYKSLQSQTVLSVADKGKACRIQGGDGEAIKLYVGDELRRTIWSWGSEPYMVHVKHVICSGTVQAVEEKVRGDVTILDDDGHTVHAIENPLAPVTATPVEIAERVCDLIRKLPESVKSAGKNDQPSLRVTGAPEG